MVGDRAGPGPIVAQSISASIASAATANCSASTSGQTQLNESGFTASSESGSSSPQTAITQAVSHTNSSRFTTAAAQASGMFFEVNMGSAQTVDEVDMSVPDYAGDYPAVTT